MKRRVGRLLDGEVVGESLSTVICMCNAGHGRRNPPPGGNKEAKKAKIIVTIIEALRLAIYILSPFGHFLAGSQLDGFWPFSRASLFYDAAAAVLFVASCNGHGLMALCNQSPTADLRSTVSALFIYWTLLSWNPFLYAARNSGKWEEFFVGKKKGESRSEWTVRNRIRRAREPPAVTKRTGYGGVDPLQCH